MVEDNSEMIQAKYLDEHTNCRICMGKGYPNSYLCTPCKCIGSMSYIHSDCLKEWIKTSKSIECEICHSIYKKKWAIWANENVIIRSNERVPINQANLNEVEEEDVESCESFLIFIVFCIIFVFIGFLTAKLGYNKIGAKEIFEIGFRVLGC